MNKYVKIGLIVLAALAVLAGLALGVLYFGFGIDPFDQSGWEVSEDGTRRYLDYYGDPMVSWQLIENNWYYLDPNGGAMRTGWISLPGGRYYLGTNGIRTTGWQTLADGTYYLNPVGGAMVTGWLDDPKGRFYLGEDGKMTTGWLELEERYYLDEAGVMQTGWLELDGGRYYLAEDGTMQTGWMDVEEGRCYLDPDSGAMHTGWLDTENGRCYLDTDGYLATGWADTDEGRFYFDENGIPATGWLDTEEGRYHLDENGAMSLGWQEFDGVTYYFREDGTMTVGQITIDGANYHFDSRGAYVLLVNKWNPLPEGYEPELVKYKGWTIEVSCYDAFVAMMDDLIDTGYYYKITSAYRNEKTQQSIWDRRYNAYIAEGKSAETAYSMVAQYVAKPGTSEHHLGLAIDITGDNAKRWLQENCWEYGFIVRYPEGKSEITGIAHEDWHYRYVGVELAMELKESGLTLEEYMANLTKAPAQEPETDATE